jgi:hypothetical protein
MRACTACGTRLGATSVVWVPTPPAARARRLPRVRGGRGHGRPDARRVPHPGRGQPLRGAAVHGHRHLCRLGAAAAGELQHQQAAVQGATAPAWALRARLPRGARGLACTAMSLCTLLSPPLRERRRSRKRAGVPPRARSGRAQALPARQPRVMRARGRAGVEPEQAGAGRRGPRLPPRARQQRAAHRRQHGQCAPPRAPATMPAPADRRSLLRPLLLCRCRARAA